MTRSEAATLLINDLVEAIMDVPLGNGFAVPKGSCVLVGRTPAMLDDMEDFFELLITLASNLEYRPKVKSNIMMSYFSRVK